MDTQIFDSLKNMGTIQIILSALLCIYGVKHLIKYRFARYYRLSGTERVDKLLLGVANLSLSSVNILLLLFLKS